MSSFQIDVSFPTFTSEFKKAKKTFPTFVNDVTHALATVQESPRVGDQIPNKIGLFKLRLGIKGQIGKSGGYRMIYHVDWEHCIITPIALYFKPDTPNLPDAEIARRYSELVKHFTQQPKSEPSPEGNTSTGNNPPTVKGSLLPYAYLSADAAGRP